MLDFIPVEKLSLLPSPRILNTHFPPHLLPVAIFDKKPKMIFIYRNPKDVAVSAFFFYKRAFGDESANLSTFIQDFPKSISKCGPIYNFKIISILYVINGCLNEFTGMEFSNGYMKCGFKRKSTSFTLMKL